MCPTLFSNLEIRGTQGRDLTIPCYAPHYLNNPSLHWSFSNGEDPSHILTYDSQTGDSDSTSPWDNHVELDGFRVPFGDGSLRLMDPKPSEHTGSYTCVFSLPYNTHTERTDVTIDSPFGEFMNTKTVMNRRDIILKTQLHILANKQEDIERLLRDYFQRRIKPHLVLIEYHSSSGAQTFFLHSV